MLKDDPKVELIIRLTVDDPRSLSPRMQNNLQEEYDKAETFDDLSPFALAMYNRTRDMLAVDDSPIMIDDTYENEHWLTPTPERAGIKSKAGLEVYLKERSMSMEAFKETPFYKMNKAAWDEMDV
jgi:hypothetical protein